jgi:hypothetical protein
VSDRITTAEQAIEAAYRAVADLEPVAWAEDGEAPADSCILQVRALAAIGRLRSLLDAAQEEK